MNAARKPYRVKTTRLWALTDKRGRICVDEKGDLKIYLRHPEAVARADYGQVVTPVLVVPFTRKGERR